MGGEQDHENWLRVVLTIAMCVLAAGKSLVAIWVNSADDFINPPELGIAGKEVK